MTVIRTGDWAIARRILATAAPRVRMAIDRAVVQEAHFLRGKIVEGLSSQSPGGAAFRPLAETTLAMRRFKGFRGTKALINRADMRNSITVQRTPVGAFVGVLRTARGRAGQPLANIAELNEWGSRPIVIRVTPKMRRFLAMALRGVSSAGGGGGGGGTGIIVVRIPARPFIRPVADRFYGNRNEVADRFLRRVAANLNFDFGGPGVISRPAGGPMAAARATRGSVSFVSRLFRGGEGPERDPRTGQFR